MACDAKMSAIGAVTKARACFSLSATACQPVEASRGSGHAGLARLHRNREWLVLDPEIGWIGQEALDCRRSRWWVSIRLRRQPTRSGFRLSGSEGSGWL